jgi:cytochrome c oxidase subunit 2
LCLPGAFRAAPHPPGGAPAARQNREIAKVKTNIWNRSALAVAALGLSAATPAHAGTGVPSPWQMGLQGPATEVAKFTYDLHTALVWIITLISLFVLGLLVVVVVKFNEKANPTASRTTHHTGLEIAWTIIPVLILVGIAIPSFRLLKFQVEIPKADMTVKVYGNQWYWSYEYPADQGGGFRFDSNMLTREEAAKAGQPALLAVDNEMVVPVGKTVVLHVIGNDVIHSFSVASLGFRMDAVPGRERRHLLWTVLAPVRPEPCVHAGGRARGERREVPGVACRREEEVRVHADGAGEGGRPRGAVTFR